MPPEPQSLDLLNRLDTFGALPVESWTPGIARLLDPVLSGMSGPGPDVAVVRDVRLDGDGGQFDIRVLGPHAEAHSIVVYLHGGGWVTGDIDYQYDNVARQLVATAGCTVVLVNYRTAPEHPFPTPLEDCFTALGWAAEHASELARADAPLVVAGDSAGGNIAAALTHRVRDEGGPRIDAQILIYPVTDCDTETASYLAEENQLFLTREAMLWFWDHYLPDERARVRPAASPLRAESFRDLPPALIYLAEFDPLRDEGHAYAEALRAAGVPVVVHEAEGQMHGFFQMADILPGFRTGLATVAAYLEKVTTHA
ncbi:alpha/beta hydrolase [Nocardia sp. NPDC002869]|uniref:alpha/beta hydrolase n=1 Tax=Nocardia sp. NPDC002869 TaxID=3161032 RepID=UPI00398CCC9F